MGEPFRAGLAVARGGAGDATAELVDPGRLGRTLMVTQVGELRAGVCGERGRRGAIRDAVAAGGLRGGHQVVADGLADPGAQPCGEPGAGRHSGQRLGERPARASLVFAGPAPFPPSRQKLPVSQENVARRGGDPFLDCGPRPQPGQRRACSSWSGAVVTSTIVHPSSPWVTAVTTRPGIPSSAVAAGHHGTPPGGAACARPGQPVASTAGGSICVFGFLGRNENCRGTAFLSPGPRNSQQGVWKCGRPAPYQLPQYR